MSWFGYDSGPPQSQTWEDRIAAPIEHKCWHCEEFFGKYDSGVNLGSAICNAKPDEFVHSECFIRFIVGSYGHLRGFCSCFRRMPGLPRMDDPPGFTKRQAALAASDWWYHRRLRPELVELGLRNLATELKHEFGFE